MNQQQYDEQKKREFSDYCILRFSRLNAEITAMEQARDVLTEFNGKVINKRLFNAIQAATGFTCCYVNNLYMTNRAKKYDDDKPAQVIIKNCYEMETGTRLNAEKAAARFSEEIKRLKEKQTETRQAADMFTDYLRQARDAAKVLETIYRENPPILRNWVQAARNLLPYNFGNGIY